ARALRPGRPARPGRRPAQRGQGAARARPARLAAAVLTCALVALPEVERVPLAVLAGGEPAVPRDGRLLSRLAAELAHLRERRVDVGRVEVEVGVACAVG